MSFYVSTICEMFSSVEVSMLSVITITLPFYSLFIFVCFQETNNTKKLLRAFTNHDKHEVLQLLPFIDQPHTVRDESRLGGLFPGSTLLQLAARRGWLDTCQVLVEQYKCKPDDTDVLGHSVLHIACLYGHVEVVKYLLRFQSVSANLGHRDGIGRTAMEYATNKYAILSLFSSYLDFSMELSVRPCLKIFLAGNC